jgi:hypothetical protein
MNTLIVAQYNENVDWISNIDLDIVVIKKGVDMDNVGREPSSFLYFIVNNYDTLDGYYYFVQGNPFDHCPNLYDMLKAEPDTKEYTPLGNVSKTDDQSGSPNHKGLAVGKHYTDVTGEESLATFTFTRGGQFRIHSDVIKKRPKEFYEKAMTYCNEVEGAPWSFERMWSLIFKEVTK